MNQEGSLNFFSLQDQDLDSNIDRGYSMTLQIKREQLRYQLRNEDLKGFLRIKRTFSFTEKVNCYWWATHQDANQIILQTIKKVYEDEKDPYLKEEFQIIIRDQIIQRNIVPYAILQLLLNLLVSSQTLGMHYEEKWSFFSALFDLFEERNQLFQYTGVLKLINKMLFEDSRLRKEMRIQSGLFTKILGKNLKYYSQNDVDQIATLSRIIFKDKNNAYIIPNKDHKIRRLFYKACKTPNGSFTPYQAETILELVFIFSCTTNQREMIQQFRKQITKAFQVLDQIDYYVLPRILLNALLKCVKESSESDKEEYANCLMKAITKMANIRRQYYYLKLYFSIIREERPQVYQPLQSFELSLAYWNSLNFVFRYIQTNYPNQQYLRNKIQQYRQHIARRPIRDIDEYYREKIKLANQILNHFFQNYQNINRII